MSLNVPTTLVVGALAVMQELTFRSQWVAD
jgi:hypothetical protein